MICKDAKTSVDGCIITKLQPVSYVTGKTNPVLIAHLKGEMKEEASLDSLYR